MNINININEDKENEPKKNLYCISYCQTSYPGTDWEEVKIKQGFIFAEDSEKAKQDLEDYLCFINPTCFFSGFQVIPFTEKDIMLAYIDVLYTDALED